MTAGACEHVHKCGEWFSNHEVDQGVFETFLFSAVQSTVGCCAVAVLIPGLDPLHEYLNCL